MIFQGTKQLMDFHIKVMQLAYGVGWILGLSILQNSENKNIIEQEDGWAKVITSN